MFNYILLGVLQGIFEWLPISSEGVVALASLLLTENINAIDLALFLHLGTFLAVLIYFRKDWKAILTRKNPQLLRFLLIATPISLAIGFFLYKLIRNIAIGSTLLLVTGIGLLATAYFHKTKKQFGLPLKNLAFLTGILQGFAVIPGLSRSGSTIFGLSFGKLQPRQILKISYLMSAPIILASTCYLLLTSPVLLSAWPALVSSFAVGFVSLSFLMKIAEKINFFIFALLFAILCFIGGLVGLFI